MGQGTAASGQGWLASEARRAILEAAAQAFGERGYRATTMADIAGAAGLKAPSLYTYFKGKVEIFAALGELLIEEVEATVATVDRGAGLEAAVVELLRGLCAWIDGRASSVRFFFEVVRTGDPVLGRARAASAGEPPDGDVRILETIGRLFEELLAKEAPGRWAWDAETLSLTLYGILDAFTLRWARGAHGAMESQAEIIARVFLHGAKGPARGIE